MSSPYTMRNKIINGAMVIDQRNAGASVTPTTDLTYLLDRWLVGLTQSSKFSVQQNAGSVTPPSGFSNYLGCTSLSAYSVLTADSFRLSQRIQGFNFNDCAWGTASAVTITLSFWVRSSLTGTFGGSLTNSAQNYSYPFTFIINSANTWEQKSVTIVGPTAGTWVGGTNGIGVILNFNLGAGATYSGAAGSWSANTYLSATGATSVVGTNGATFYITGVQLERGTVATPFEYRNYQQELAMCQRYFALAPIYGTGIACTTTTWDCTFAFPVPMRATPTMSANTTVTITNVTTADYTQSSANINTDVNTGSATSHLRFGNFTGLTAGNIYQVRNGNIYVNASAEL